MRGLSIQTTAWHRPRELALRLLIIGGLVFLLCGFFGRGAVEPWFPVFRAAIPFIDDHFAILDIDLAEEGSNQTVRFRANLTRPVTISGKTFYPFGSGPMPSGGFQVTLTLGSVLQYGALMIIAILAWPAARMREYVLRAVVATPLLITLLLTQVSVTVLAELWNLVDGELDPGTVRPLMILSRFLMGGGGLALGIFLAGVAIAFTAVKSRGVTNVLRSTQANTSSVDGVR